MMSVEDEGPVVEWSTPTRLSTVVRLVLVLSAAIAVIVMAAFYLWLAGDSN